MIISDTVLGVLGADNVFYELTCALVKDLNLGRGKLFEAVNSYGNIVFTARESKGGSFAVGTLDLGKVDTLKYLIGVAGRLEGIQESILSNRSYVSVLDLIVFSVHFLGAPRKKDCIDGKAVSLLQCDIAEVERDADVVIFVDDNKSCVTLLSSDDELGLVNEERNVRISLRRGIISVPIGHIEE